MTHDEFLTLQLKAQAVSIANLAERVVRSAADGAHGEEVLMAIKSLQDTLSAARDVAVRLAERATMKGENQ